MNGWVRNNDAFTAGRAAAHLTHASSQKVGGRSCDILGRSGDALAHSGDIPGRSMTLRDAPGRSGTLQRRFGGHSGGLCGPLGGWMDDADDRGGDGDGDGEGLRLSFLYIQTPDQPPPRPLC